MEVPTCPECGETAIQRFYPVLVPVTVERNGASQWLGEVRVEQRAAWECPVCPSRYRHLARFNPNHNPHSGEFTSGGGSGGGGGSTGGSGGRKGASSKKPYQGRQSMKSFWENLDSSSPQPGEHQPVMEQAHHATKAEAVSQVEQAHADSKAEAASAEKASADTKTAQTEEPSSSESQSAPESSSSPSFQHRQEALTHLASSLRAEAAMHQASKTRNKYERETAADHARTLTAYANHISKNNSSPSDHQSLLEAVKSTQRNIQVVHSTSSMAASVRDRSNAIADQIRNIVGTGQ